MLSRVLDRIRAAGVPKSSGKWNLVAFSGGVDSSVVAAGVFQLFPENSIACLGISPSLSSIQRELAHRIARENQFQLEEIQTQEGQDRDYVANAGQSCYVCKTNLYRRTISSFCTEQYPENTVVFNGTNADDRLDPTRLGLIAAEEFHVISPLQDCTKAQVREIAKEWQLSNWNYAPSPCLRSRLELGVFATEDHLQRVAKAEALVQSSLPSHFFPEGNLRVRTLAGNRAMIEIDSEWVSVVEERLSDLEAKMLQLDFESLSVRAFRTGSVSGYQKPTKEQAPGLNM